MIDYSTRKYSKVTDIRDQKKIDLLLEIIPEEVKTIIDIGCGNGIITNALNRYYDVLGTDINASKLKFVHGESLLSSSDDINRPDESFDLVFSSEMIEHLESDLFERSLAEMDRLSKKYVLITVPNNEPLHKLMLKCERCGKLFNKNGHLHTFTKESMKSLHSNWEPLLIKEFGRKARKYKKWIADLKHTYTPPSSWIPKHWIKTQGVNAHHCIHCNHVNETKGKFHPISFFLDSLNVLLASNQPDHLMGLYTKKNN